jgi:S1/P1 Nuclease
MKGKAFPVHRAAAVFALMLLVASNALGWGREGHEIVAAIAERHLTATARERVRHQPLHCADDHDRGGNDVHVTFFGENANLHSVWDTLLIERIDSDPGHYANRLDGV